MESKTVEVGTMLSDEQMHTLTRQELEDYYDSLWSAWRRAGVILKYRKLIGDDNNPYLLEAKNVVVMDDEED
jgi:hypothetical protein